MTATEESSSHKALMTGSAAAVAGSATALALKHGNFSEGIEYASQAKDLVEPVFYDPELTEEGASSLKDYAVGNLDTAMHFLSGAGLSGLANKVLEPGNRTKALAAGLGAGTVGYALLKEGMYEGALDAFDVSYESLKAASSPLDHIVDEAGDIDLNADQERDITADTLGATTERAASTKPAPSYNSETVEDGSVDMETTTGPDARIEGAETPGQPTVT